MKITILIGCILFSFLKHGFANQTINSPDSLKNDSKNDSSIIQESKILIKAIGKGDLDLVKSLIASGVNPNFIDIKGYTPLDYAKKGNRPNVEQYLISIGAKTYPKRIKSFIDGPYIRISDSMKIVSSFLVFDSLNNESSTTSEKYNFSELPRLVDGILIEPKDIDLNSNKTFPKGVYEGIDKLFVIGDVHGEYDRVVKLLKSNKIVNDNGNWTWGKGHLVFMGDIFDRGSKVTEMFWFIFSLEKQAERDGGKVHLLLGNHEPMIFKNDLRYVANNYYALCENLGLSYSALYNEKTVLGNWIRQKPAILKINDYVFVHGGIPSRLYETKLEIDSVNKIVWQFFNHKENSKNTEVRTSILGGKGILWYRGFIPYGERADIIDESTLDKELHVYNAKAFIIGHTEVDSISTFFHGKVIDVNIPRADKKIKEQGLLIKKDKIYIVYETDKPKEIIK